MTRWISAKRAAHKYGIDVKDVCLWAEVGEIASVITEKTLAVDDESIQEFLDRVQTLPTRDYIHSLHQLNENKQTIIDSYDEIRSMQQAELELQKEENALLKKMQEVMEQQISKLEEMARNQKKLNGRFTPIPLPLLYIALFIILSGVIASMVVLW